VSSVPTILDMVRRGHGYGTLTGSAVSQGDGPEALTRTPIVGPRIDSTVCLAWRVAKRRDALHLRTGELLAQIARGLVA
jgi:LysR family nitrogen assimilation transcriptional regulator